MSAAAHESPRASCGATAAAAGGLLVRLPAAGAPETVGARASKLNAFVHVGADDSVTLFIHKAEMGQGTVTSLSMLLAEELECDWKKIRTEFPGVEPRVRRQPGRGRQRQHPQFLGIAAAARAPRRARCWCRQPRRSGAWTVARCRAENSFVVNTATNARLSYGSLAEAASKLPVPADVDAQGSRQFQHRRQADQAARHAGQGGWQRDVRHRCAAARHAVRGGGALPGVRRQGGAASTPPRPRPCRA